jgi:intraflagellar transport protein 81
MQPVRGYDAQGHRTGPQFNPNQLYEGQGNYGQSEFVSRTIIGTEEIREIVAKLNAKPFDENFTLVKFDDLTPLELLELLNRVIVQIDSQQDINVKYEQQSVDKICDFLRVMNYPSNYDQQFQTNLMQGDKKTVHPILYYLLKNLPDLKKRAYLAKFLVPITVPPEFLTDDDMRNLFQEYKDLQAEFQVNHQQLEEVQKNALSPGDIQKEIKQLEQEKDQLNVKINLFKSKNSAKPEFQTLLQATNLLRREQEEEAKLAETYRIQRQQLEFSDQQLLSAQQRFIDARNSLSVDNTADHMLHGLRAEVKKNRDLCNERLGFEINEKRKKLEQIEQLLSEPPVSINQINSLENGIVILRRAVQNLEEKLKREANPEQDKLAIYKQQANLVAKKKEKILEELKKAEEDSNRKEKDLRKKEAEMEKTKGPGYKSKDDFKQYAATLREKTQKFKKMNDELKELKNEIGVLSRTEQIVRRQKDEAEQVLRHKEAERGVSGASSTQQGINAISEAKSGVDSAKGKTLEELSKVVVQMEAKMKEKKITLAPFMKELKEIRDRYQEVEREYTAKKSEYNQIMAGAEAEGASLEDEVKKLKEEVYGDDTKLTKLKYQTQIVEQMTKRLNDENDYLAGSKEFSRQYKSYRDMYKAIIKQQEGEVKEFKAKRDEVKGSYEPSLKQTAMLNDLKKLLRLKVEAAKRDGGSRQYEGRGGMAQGNVNRLVIEQ